MKRIRSRTLLLLVILSVAIANSSCQIAGTLLGGYSAEEKRFAEYLIRNNTPITSVDDANSFDDLEPLMELAANNRVFMFGEAHGIVENYKLTLRMMKWLHTLGYRYLALEMDWAYTDLLNDYLRTGDESILLGMDMWTYPSAGNNEDTLEFYRGLCEWNASLPESERITIWATDIAHGPNATRSKVADGLRSIPDEAMRDHLLAALEGAMEPTPAYSELKSFEMEFLDKTAPLKDSIEDYDKLALYVRLLKDTEAWRRIDKDPSIAEDYPGVEEIREEASLAIWEYMLNNLDAGDKGKVFFHGGGWHTVIAVNKGVTRRLGTLLNETVPQVAGKVATLYAIPVSGKVRKSDGSNANVQTYSGRTKMRAALDEIPHRWSLVINSDGVYHPDGGLYRAYIILRDCTAARNRSRDGDV